MHLRRALRSILLPEILVATLLLGRDCRPADDASFTIGMSQCNLGEPWRVQMNADLRAAAAQQPGLRVVFKDAQSDTFKQRAHVEQFVSAGVDRENVSGGGRAPS